MTQSPQNPPGHSWQQPGPENYGAEHHGGPYGFAGPAEDLASRWARFGGGILDGIIVLAIHAILLLPTVHWDRIGDEGTSRFDVVSGGAVFAGLGATVIAFFYYWIQHAMWGRTLGKRAVGTRVVRAEDGSAISWGQAAWRIGFAILFGYLVNIVTCGFGGWLALIDPAWILWDRRRQALHDKVARTVVVKVDPAERDPYAER